MLSSNGEVLMGIPVSRVGYNDYDDRLKVSKIGGKPVKLSAICCLITITIL